jgi:hypothetical protein
MFIEGSAGAAVCWFKPGFRRGCSDVQMRHNPTTFVSSRYETSFNHCYFSKKSL